jgi:MoaA/NifB/PqqE/SkfB family radical SAM enzyme
MEKTDTQKRWKFSELLAVDTEMRNRWEKVRKYFFLRESTYDMTNRCNMRCDGCYYYEGDKQFAKENHDLESWRNHMKKEKARGITYVVLAGAEPALVSELIRVCHEEMPLGCIASNGLKRIPESIGYKIHISVWGNDETSQKVRKAKNLLQKQINNYQDDPRAIFIYTFCRNNISEVHEVVDILVSHNCKVTFNTFSAPTGYSGELKHDQESLTAVRHSMIELMEKYPEHVLFSHYNAVVHTHKYGLHELYSCPYPHMNSSTSLGLGRSFRQYRTDLTWDRATACCVPDTDCLDCRHYAAGSAVVTAKLFSHAINPDTFRSWLDYVDTYLAVWIAEYEKSKNLCNYPVPPPSFDLMENEY